MASFRAPLMPAGMTVRRGSSTVLRACDEALRRIRLPPPGDQYCDLAAEIDAQT
jgi:hypothetical protein